MKKLFVKEMKFETINGKLYCREIYENDESFLILVEEDPTEFIKKIGRLKDGITQEDLNKAFEEIDKEVETMKKLSKKIKEKALIGLSITLDMDKIGKLPKNKLKELFPVE